MEHFEQSHLKKDKRGLQALGKLRFFFRVRHLSGALLLGIPTILVLTACGGDRPTEEGGLRVLNPDTLWIWLEQGKEMVLMDARPDVLFEAGHIAGSVRVHDRRVGEVRAVLPFRPEVPIIFTSEHGRLPVDEEHLAHVLVNQGFPQVWWLGEGIEGWRKRSYPLDGSRVFPRR